MSENLKLETQIEAILFWKAEPISYKKLSQILEKDENDIIESVNNLKVLLNDRGITIVQTDTEVTLGTSKSVAGLIEKLTKEELIKDLGKAGLETISIILYQGPISRAEIDYIRGVNSQFIIRNLLIRGLIEKVDNPKDQRSFLYKASINLIAHLGISNINELPDFENVRNDIENFKNQKNDEQSAQN